MAILIAFYSRAGENYFGGTYRRVAAGNTEKAAEMLSRLTGGELFKIEQARPYSENYQTCIAEAKADGRLAKWVAVYTAEADKLKEK